MVLETYNFVMSHKFLRVMILALLVFSVIFCGVMVEYSHAIAWLVPAVEVVATLLIACGVISSTDSDLEHVATDLYNSLSGDALKDVINIAGTYSSVTSGNFTFKATPAILSAVSSWISSVWTNSGVLRIDGTLIIGNCDFSWIDCYKVNNYSDMYDIMRKSAANYCNKVPPSSALPFHFFNTDMISQSYIISTPKGFDFSEDGITGLGYADGGQLTGFAMSYELETGDYRLWYYSSVTGYFQYFNLTSGSYAPSSGVTITDIPYTQAESDTTYFPKEVVDAAGGTTTFPSNTASKPLTTETPLTIPQEGVNSTTVPGDVRTDAPVTDIPTTEIGWLEKLWDGVSSIPDAIVGAGSALIDFLTDLVVPSDALWDDFMTNVIDIVAPPNTVNFNKYVSSIAIPDVTGTYKGKKYTFVDNSKLRANVETWRKYIGAFLAVLLVIYNYNMFMKFIGMGTLTLTESGRVPDISINNLSGNVALPAPKGRM